MFKFLNRYDQTPGGENIACKEFKEKLDRGDKITILDVRESWEYDTAKIAGSKLIPLAELEKRKGELNPEEEIVVHCHKGVRSLKAVRLLRQHGFAKARSLSGGIDAWSKEVDSSVPTY